MAWPCNTPEAAGKVAECGFDEVCTTAFDDTDSPSVKAPLDSSDGCFGDAEELCGEQQPPRRVVPAYEGLEPHEVDDGLDAYRAIAARLPDLLLPGGIVALEIGYDEVAQKYLRYAVLMDLADVGGNVRDGVHVASIGGTWMAVAYGLACVDEWRARGRADATRARVTLCEAPVL